MTNFSLLNKILEALVRAGGKPLIVGGAVRDMITKAESKDIDLEVFGLTISELMTALEDFNPDLVGKSFGVVKIADFDIAIPRAEKKVGIGHTGFVVEFDPNMSFEDALRRRDFTMNAIALDPITEKFIDPFGGIQDIEDRVLKIVDAATFIEDPLRVLRAVQFTVRFNLDVDGETTEACRQIVASGAMEQISIERIWTEFEKIFSKSTDSGSARRLIKAFGLSEMLPGSEFMLDGVSFENVPSVEAQLAVHCSAMRNGLNLAFLPSIGCPSSVQATVNRLLMAFRVLCDGRDAASGRIALRMLKSPEKIRFFQTMVSFLEPDLVRFVQVGVLAPIVTGETLIGMGMKPGPLFGLVLAECLDRQDRLGLTTMAEIEEFLKETVSKVDN